MSGHAGRRGLIADSDSAQAFPARCPADLLGRIRVLLRAEDGNLVGYGFGGQRVVIPAGSAGAVVTVDRYRTEHARHGPRPARARPQAADPAAGERTVGDLRRGGPGLPRGRAARAAARDEPWAPAPHGVPAAGPRRAWPHYQKAPGYRRLRMAPRTTPLRAAGRGGAVPADHRIRDLPRRAARGAAPRVVRRGADADRHHRRGARPRGRHLARRGDPAPDGGRAALGGQLVDGADGGAARPLLLPSRAVGPLGGAGERRPGRPDRGHGGLGARRRHRLTDSRAARLGACRRAASAWRDGVRAA